MSSTKKREPTVNSRLSASIPSVPWNPNYRILYSFKKIRQALLTSKPDAIEIGCPYILRWVVCKIYKNVAKNEQPKIIGFYPADFLRA